MPFNGAGVFGRVFNFVTDRNNGIKILASRMDGELDGFATGLSNTITRDGQSTISADIPFNNRKITGLANATNDADALNRITADGRFLSSADGSVTTAKLDDDAVTTVKIADGAVTDAKLAPQARADVASATTTDIGAATTQYVRITGTTTITGLGTADAGVVRDVVFEGALTLTHNATSLILPGAANIVTVAGDTALFRSEGSGNWRCVRYQRATGAPLLDAVTVYITDQKATSGGTFTSGAWRTRDLNTEVDPSNICTLSSNQFTLAAGTYDITASAPAYTANRHQARLQNVTAGTTVAGGTSEIANTSQTRSVVTVRVTLNGTDALEVQHRCQTTSATIGFGVNSGFGQPEIYTTVFIRKVG